MSHCCSGDTVPVLFNGGINVNWVLCKIQHVRYSIRTVLLKIATTYCTRSFYKTNSCFVSCRGLRLLTQDRTVAGRMLTASARTARGPPQVQKMSPQSCQRQRWSQPIKKKKWTKQLSPSSYPPGDMINPLWLGKACPGKWPFLCPTKEVPVRAVPICLPSHFRGEGETLLGLPRSV